MNLIEIEDLISKFLERNSTGIKTIHKMYYKTDNTLSFDSLNASLKEELKNGCITYVNNKYPINGIDAYLFYIVHAYCKRNATYKPKTKSSYICPGCLSLNKNIYCSVNRYCITCDECTNELKSCKDIKKLLLFQTFSKHSKAGFRCSDCNRFIPHNDPKSETLKCPYLDCCFVGQIENLKKMHHPAKQIAETSLINNMQSNTPKPDELVIEKNDIENTISIIKEIIESQLNTLQYNSSSFTIRHKQFVYTSFLNLLQEYPEEMSAYLSGDRTENSGFQHKVFQEYIRLLEMAFPFTLKKANKVYKIESLLDKNLNIFDGISTFTSTITEKLEIKNNTQEYYIGGRNGTYSKPFYIGKILDITCNNKSILSDVKEYSFSRIKLKNGEPFSEVKVTHLRIPPHYQMGGMVHVNRIRKKIVDKVKDILNSDEKQTY